MDLSKVEMRRHSAAHIALNCFQCIAYVLPHLAEVSERQAGKL